MALFAYPVSQENDAERAMRAALAIQRGLAELNRSNAAPESDYRFKHAGELRASGAAAQAPASPVSRSTTSSTLR